MKYRRFGKTALEVSEIGFGAWAIGGAVKLGNLPIGWGRTDDDESMTALHTAFEEGVNFYDTADFYGLGHSEELIGNAFGNDSKVIIATKVGQKPGLSKPVEIDYSREYMLQACEASLKRLKRSYIDYYQLHVASIDHLQQGDCIEAMNHLVKQGKVRYWGISLFTYNPFPEAEYMLKYQMGDGFQLAFNMINQKAIPLFNAMHEKGYGIIARMPLQFGLLAGKFKPSMQFDETDHRSFRLTPGIINDANGLLKKLEGLCSKYKTDPASLALSFILSFPEISTTIPGIRTAVQARENSRHAVELQQEDRKLIMDMFECGFENLLSQMQKQG
ncbi:MAG: aldo/keto reductase [Chitinophagaceae bacterium]